MTHSWKPAFTQSDKKILSEKIVFPGYCQVTQYKFQYRLFAGGMSEPIQRQVLTRPHAVGVLLYDPDVDKVVLIEQFRAGALEEESPWLLEVVAGMMDPGESIEDTIHREVQEETGCTIQSMLPICTYLLSPGATSEKMFVYCARVKTPKESRLCGLVAEGEDIKVHVLSTQDVFKLLQEGKIVSSPTVIAVQWLQINLASLRFPQ